MVKILVIGPSGVRALPLAAGINEGGHYFRYFFLFLLLVLLLTTAIQNHRRGCRRVFKFLHGLLKKWAERRVSCAQTRERGPPSVQVEIINRFTEYCKQYFSI